MKHPVLLIGNGINNVTSEYQWGDLVKDLIQRVDERSRLRIANKPFPLLYEEIVAHAVREKNIREAQIKNFIAEKIAQFRPNEIHQHIVELRLDDLLTTNYDYTLEMASGIPENRTPVNAGVVKENRYSLFRVVQAGQSKIWHIHGERKLPHSIALGYEHYSGYLQVMRNYVVMGTEKAYKKRFAALEQRLRQNKVHFDSWVDFFFTRDIFIVGLSLDFVEMHLWWLLTYRARRKYTHTVPVKNRIVYFYPSGLATQARDKLDLFRASDVDPRSILLRSGDWKAYYHRVLDAIEKEK